MLNRKLKDLGIAVIVIAVLILAYRVFFIRIVNYEIAGVKIPSQYNVLTGSVKPIEDYKGTGQLPAVKPSLEPSVGLTTGEVAAAKLRWSVFGEWVKGHPEYSGWSDSIETFKKANQEFREEMKNFGKAGTS